MANGNKNNNKKSKTWIVIVILVVIIAAIAFAIFGRKEKALAVTAEKVEKRNITQVVTASGKIYPEIEVSISPDVSGEIVNLGVRDGQKVSKGQFLAEIRPEILQFQVDQIRAGLAASQSRYDVAKRDLERVKDLYSKKLVSDSELENAQNAMEVAKANLDQQKAQLEQSEENLRKTRIQSPIDGRISQLLVEQGERVVGTSQFTGTEMMKIADFSSMEVRVDVNENDVVNVSLGDTARISIDAMKDTTFSGIVFEIAHSPVTTGLGTQEEVTNYPVKIRIINPSDKFRSGMSATVDIETDYVKDAWAVPIQSVTIRRDIDLDKKPDSLMAKGDEEKSEKKEQWSSSNGRDDDEKKDPPRILFYVDNGVAKIKKVETGISDDQFIEIKSGLTGEEKVVTGSYRAISRELQPDMKVREEQKAEFGANRQNDGDES